VILADGSRQLVSVNLPGDILGLPGLAMREPIDAVMALTPVETIRIGQDQIGELFTASPRIAAIMFLISQEERSLLMERLALTGQADALTRLAALILRLHERHALSEEDPERGFFMPLTQREMGELIGVSSVHTNSLIKQLRVEGVVSVANRRMVIHDPARLSEIAGVPPWHRSKPRWLPKTVAP
jgi:CRP-like cAMP-binding protein